MGCAFNAVENYGILLNNNLDFANKRDNGGITNRGELVEYARSNNFFKPHGIFKKRRAAIFRDNFRYRTSAVEVDIVGLRMLFKPGAGGG